MGNRLADNFASGETKTAEPTPFSYSSPVPQTPRHKQHSTEGGLALEKNTGSYEALLKAVWCPICGCKLTVQEKDGKKTLNCSQHGEMKVFLDHDPKAGGDN